SPMHAVGDLSNGGLRTYLPDPDGPPQKLAAVRAYKCATRSRSSIDTHSFRVCWPPARGPCVMAAILAWLQKQLPSSTKGFGPVTKGRPLMVAYELWKASTSRAFSSNLKASRMKR